MPHLQKFEIYDSNTIEFSTMLRIRLAIAAMLFAGGRVVRGGSVPRRLITRPSSQAAGLRPRLRPFSPFADLSDGLLDKQWGPLAILDIP